MTNTVDMRYLPTRIYAKPGKDNDVAIRITAPMATDEIEVKARIPVEAVPQLLSALSTAAIIAAYSATAATTRPQPIEGDEITTEIEGVEWHNGNPQGNAALVKHAANVGDINHTARQMIRDAGISEDIDWQELDRPSESANW